MKQSDRIDPKHVLASIEREGICVLPDFLPASEVEAIAREGHELARDMPSFLKKHPRDRDASFMLNLIPARLTRHHGWGRVPSFERIKSLPVVRSTADGYLGTGWGTTNFIYNYSVAATDDELFPLHIDVFEGLKGMKVYVYLNAGSRENGAFRYIPRSHRLARAAAPKMAQVLGTHKVTENALSDVLKALDRHPDLIADPEMAEAHRLLQDLDRNPDKSYDYVVSGGPGTVVIFDTIGVHGGGRVYSGERYIARYHFVGPEFVFKNLPDQLPPVKRALSHARRISRKLFMRKAANG